MWSVATFLPRAGLLSQQSGHHQEARPTSLDICLSFVTFFARARQVVHARPCLGSVALGWVGYRLVSESFQRGIRPFEWKGLRHVTSERKLRIVARYLLARRAEQSRSGQPSVPQRHNLVCNSHNGDGFSARACPPQLAIAVFIQQRGRWPRRTSPRHLHTQQPNIVANSKYSSVLLELASSRNHATVAPFISVGRLCQ